MLLKAILTTTLYIVDFHLEQIMREVVSLIRGDCAYNQTFVII
jgi:hypothetical protein